MNKKILPKLLFILAMSVFGTIGIFRRFIPLSSAMLSFVRGVIGIAVLLLIMLLTRKKPDFGAIKANLKFLVPSGVLIGLNWILLFEAYNYTTVAVATLCYYMEPTIIVITSYFLFKERMTKIKSICVFAALVGMVMVSGILKTENSMTDLKGPLFGICAAFLYSGVVILNKYIKNISAYDKTVVQLASAAVVILPYILLTERDFSFSVFTPKVTVMVLIVGVIHTGIAYALYFASISELKAQTSALFSYIDPVVAVLVSAFILKEKMEISEIIGVVLILVSTVLCELTDQKNDKKAKKETK